MNPPSAIQGTMGRERKPFTYTPGGLDLSEIKSERMAKRLMRNAMNQGVLDLPPPTINSPPVPSSTIAVPNFNCLPVQVFPSFQLPANPKSLLRTRSTPDQLREAPQRSLPRVNNIKSNDKEHQVRETVNKTNMPVNNNNYSGNVNTISRTNYGSDAYNKPLLPEISYDAEYFEVRPARGDNFESCSVITPLSTENNVSVVMNPETVNTGSEFRVQLLTDSTVKPEPVIKPVDCAGTDDDEQRVVEKQVKIEEKMQSETKTGEQNGDTNNVEAEMTVKLPTKKSVAKTETKVDVVKRILQDGSEEEVTTTTTTTTKDGRTEISTRTQTKITPKQIEVEEEEEEEEEEEDETKEGEESNTKKEPVQETIQDKPSENIVKKEERSETTTTKKIVVLQKSNEEVQKPEAEEAEEEEADDEEEEEEVVAPIQKQPVQESQIKEKSEFEENIEVVEVKKEEIKEKLVKENFDKENKEKETEVEAKEGTIEKKEPAQDEEEDEEYVEVEIQKSKPEKESIPEKEAKPAKETKEEEEDEESEYTEEEYESEKEEPKANLAKPTEPEVPKQEETKEEVQPPVIEQKVPLREPSIPLEKVEDVEIKPIGASTETVSKSHSETTEIIRSNDKPSGGLSTQTEFNRFENIVTVNRTTKTLDRSYEQLTQQGIPTVKTYFAPDRERVSTSPQPSRPYQSSFTPQPKTEKRHSLLLERLSTERQMPSELYQNQYNNQNYDQQRLSQEPQSEVINASNVKPSSITNQQWYQQTRKDNVIYNNVESSPALPTQQQWSQPQPQQPLQPQNLYQPANSDVSQDINRYTTNDYQQSNYTSSYAPTINNWGNNNVGGIAPSYNAQPTQYSSYTNKDSTESYHKTLPYSSTYVPPPWEQDSHYIAPELPSHNYYQAPPTTNTFNPATNQGWKPTPPAAKFTKPISSSYVPPAPNQSFVMTNLPPEMPKIPGRKTYYSEYERRYITVPESTYIPSETKYQPQPDPSPQYYYDSNEPSETVEHQWRKELREFTEKSTQPQQFQPQQQTQNDPQTSVRPPWEQETKYGKAPAYTPQPSWSQTLRPQSWRERSFESEYVENKTSTLGRGRPLSSYGNSNIETISERPRGVSVDRYNPNNYQTPGIMEHGPVPTHTLNPPTKPFTKGYHNPNVPAYHSRPSAEIREHPTAIPQARWGDSRESPIQSRSFKYLQWITGTEN